MSVEKETEIRERVRESLETMPLAEMLAGAVKSVQKHGFRGFLNNHKKVIEDAVVYAEEFVQQKEINLSIEQSKKKLENE